MKKKLLFLILFLLVIFAGYKFVKSVEGIETQDLEYNTVYSEKYNEDLFDDKLLSKTKNEIIDKLGKPFETIEFKPYLKFLYSNKNDSIYINCSGGVNTSSIIGERANFLVFEFDDSAKVTNVFSMKNDQKIDSDSLLGISENEVIDRFGKPSQIAQINFAGTILSFSNLKEGAYTGKQPKIHMRNIIFDKNDRAVKVVKVDGYNSLDGLCEVISEN